MIDKNKFILVTAVVGGILIGVVVGRYSSPTNPTNTCENPAPLDLSTPQGRAEARAREIAERIAQAENTYPLDVYGTVESVDESKLTLKDSRSGETRQIIFNAQTTFEIQTSVPREEYEKKMTAYRDARRAFDPSSGAELPPRPAPMNVTMGSITDIKAGVSLTATLSEPGVASKITVSAN